MAYQAKQLKVILLKKTISFVNYEFQEQNQALMTEMGSRIRESVDVAKDEANSEINKCRNEMGKNNTTAVDCNC